MVSIATAKENPTYTKYPTGVLFLKWNKVLYKQNRIPTGNISIASKIASIKRIID